MVADGFDRGQFDVEQRPDPPCEVLSLRQVLWDPTRSSVLDGLHLQIGIDVGVDQSDGFLLAGGYKVRVYKVHQQICGCGDMLYDVRQGLCWSYTSGVVSGQEHVTVKRKRVTHMT